MNNKTFTEMMEEILSDCDEYTTAIVPNFLKQVLDNIIEERQKIDDLDPNECSATISLKKDSEGNSYIEYFNDKGATLLILQDGINYTDFSFGIKVNTVTLEDKIKELYDQIREKKYVEYMQDGLDKFKAGDKQGGSEKIHTTSEGYKETDDKTGKEILDRILLYFKEEIEKNRRAHNIQCYIAEEERDERTPRGERHPRMPKEHRGEYDNRFTEIEKIIGKGPYAIINDNKYVSYFYDLQKNGQGETGYILLIEPKDIDQNGLGTKIGYLSVEEYDKIKEKLKNRKQKYGNEETDLDVTDEDVKDEFIKFCLGDLKQKEKMVSVRHRNGDFEGFINRIKYYITGDKSLGRDYIYKLREKLLGEAR